MLVGWVCPWAHDGIDGDVILLFNAILLSMLPSLAESRVLDFLTCLSDQVQLWGTRSLPRDAVVQHSTTHARRSPPQANLE